MTRAKKNIQQPPGWYWDRHEFRITARQPGSVLLHAMWPAYGGPVQSQVSWSGTCTQAIQTAKRVAKDLSSLYPRNPNPVLVFDRIGGCMNAYQAGHEVDCPHRGMAPNPRDRHLLGIDRLPNGRFGVTHVTIHGDGSPPTRLVVGEQHGEYMYNYPSAEDVAMDMAKTLTKRPGSPVEIAYGGKIVWVYEHGQKPVMHPANMPVVPVRSGP